MKKKMIKISLVLLTLMLLVATATMAVYADWDGTSSTTGGSGGVPATGGYAIHSSESLEKIVVGYRFSYATVSGTTWTKQGNTGMDQEACIEVWRNAGNSLANEHYTNASCYTMMPLTTKIEYANAWKGKSATTFPSLASLSKRSRSLTRLGMATEQYFTTAYSDVNGCGYGYATSALPTTPAGMESWIGSGYNLDRVAKDLGIKNGASALNSNYIITCEPVFFTQFAGSYISATSSQYAQLGGSIYQPTDQLVSGVYLKNVRACPGPDWNTSYDYNGTYFYYNSTVYGAPGKSGSTQGTYSFLRQYFNYHFPVSLYTTEADSLSVAPWSDPSLPTDTSVLDYCLQSSRTIMEQGYGVGLAYASNEKPATYLHRLYVRYENADGSYTGYSLVSSGNYESGKTFPAWSRAEDTTYQAASFAAYTTGSSAKDNYVTVDRQEFPVDIQVRYQNSSGGWGSYSSVSKRNYNYGQTHPGWSRAADTTYKAASLAGFTVTGATTKYVDVYRNQYTVTLSKGTGISSVSGAGTYYAGASVTIDATPSSGYSWSKWSGSHSTTTKKYTFTINSNISDTANATANNYTLTINPNGGKYNESTEVQNFTKTIGQTTGVGVPTRDGYTFAGWDFSGYGSMNRHVGLDSSPSFASGSHVSVYNNNGNGTVTHTRVSDSTNPMGTGYSLKIQTTGVAAPHHGGFYNGTTSAASQKFLHVFVAKVPQGYQVINAQNDCGDGDDFKWLTGQYGTGEWETYAYVTICGSTGTFSTFGHVYLAGGSTATSSSPVVWYLGSSQIYNITDSLSTYTFGAGNGTLTARWIPTAEYSGYTTNWIWGVSAEHGNSSNPKTGVHIGNKNVHNGMYKNTAYIVDASHGKDAPNGFYLNSTFGTSAISGSFKSYAMGTTVIQKASNMSFEFDWYPNDYSITYDLDGGKNHASNPSSYNVLYPVTFYNPTKDGCTFAGWTIDGTHNKGNMTYVASTGNYNYQSVMNRLVPGGTYSVSISNATRTAGTATYCTAIIFDFTKNTTLAETTFTFGSAKTFMLTCPSSATAGNDIRLLIYAGPAGSTAGNAMTLTGVTVNFRNVPATGVNVGISNANFASWSNEGNYDAIYNELASRTTGNLTAKAIWKTNTFTLTINPNGGSYGGSTSNSTFTLPAGGTKAIGNPTKTGCTFAGWSISGSGSLNGTTYTQGSGNCTLTAQWHPNLTINYYSNGATTAFSEALNAVGSGKNVLVKTWTVTADRTWPESILDYTYTSASTYLARRGYTGTGYWGTTTSGGTLIKQDTNFADIYAMAKALGVTLTKNGTAKSVNVYAQWTPITYTIKYNLNGGPGSIAAHTVQYDSSTTIQTPEARLGYTFLGWTTNPDGTTDDGYNWTGWSGKWARINGEYGIADNTLQLYARWKPNTYTNTINHWMAGFTSGEGTDNSKKYLLFSSTTFDQVYGTSFDITPSRAVTIPNGFRLDSVFGTRAITGSAHAQYEFNRTLTQTAEALTFDYYYVPNTYSITYDLNDDGDGVGPAQNNASNPTSYNVLYGKAFLNPSRVGYDFQGWHLGNIEVTGFNVGVDNSSLASMTTDQIYAVMNARTTGNKTVVAQWKARTDTKYVVRHYRMNTDGSTYSLFETQNLTGTSDATLTLANLAKNYNGWKYLCGKVGNTTVTTTTILPDGSRVINLYYDLQFDVELSEIIIKDENNNVVTNLSRVPMGKTYTVWHTYRNNSVHDLIFNGYHNGNKVTFPDGKQTVEIRANSSKTIQVGSFYAAKEGDFNITGAVYRNGMTVNTENYETDLNDNVRDLDYTVVANLPWLEFIDPNQAYRENTDVITSLWLHNDTEDDFGPSMHLKVRIRIYDNNNNQLLMTMEQPAVVPAGEDQLVYFKWHVPTISGLASSGLTIKADLSYSLLPYYKNEVSKNDFDYIFWNVHQTPDTKYEDTRPGYWTKPSSPSVQMDSASWYVWEYTNGTFKKVTYGVQVTPGTTELTPSSKTAYRDSNGRWHMKSGYGFYVNSVGSTVSQYGSYLMPHEDAYTGSQYNYLMFPEFSYGNDDNEVATLEKIGNIWQLYEFLGYGRKHFTPLWYPDGTYAVKIVQTDIWTPMGALTVYGVANTIEIEGDLYDDWYNKS